MELIRGSPDVGACAREVETALYRCGGAGHRRAADVRAGDGQRIELGLAVGEDRVGGGRLIGDAADGESVSGARTHRADGEGDVGLRPVELRAQDGQRSRHSGDGVVGDVGDTGRGKPFRKRRQDCRKSRG